MVMRINKSQKVFVYLVLHFSRGFFYRLFNRLVIHDSVENASTKNTLYIFKAKRLGNLLEAFIKEIKTLYSVTRYCIKLTILHFCFLNNEKLRLTHIFTFTLT